MNVFNIEEAFLRCYCRKNDCPLKMKAWEAAIKYRAKWRH